MYRCPVCLHASFESVSALWQGLMSGASRRLACPVCAEELLGLDKLTLHLYSHLPVPRDCTQGDAELASTAQCFQDDTRQISEHRNQEKKGTFQVKSSTLIKSSEETTEDLSKNEDQDDLNITGDFSPVHFMSVFHQEVSNTESPVKYNLHETSHSCQSSIGTADTLEGLKTLASNASCSASAGTPPAGLAMFSCSPPQELPSAPFGPELCRECGATFATPRMLSAHTQLVHPPRGEEKRQECPFACHLCAKRFKMRGSLMVHVRFVHGGSRLGGRRGGRGVQGDTQAASPEPFFPSLSELSEQLAASPGQRAASTAAQLSTDLRSTQQQQQPPTKSQVSECMEESSSEVSGEKKRSHDGTDSSATWQSRENISTGNGSFVTSDVSEEAQNNQWMSSCFNDLPVGDSNCNDALHEDEKWTVNNNQNNCQVPMDTITQQHVSLVSLASNTSTRMEFISKLGEQNLANKCEHLNEELNINNNSKVEGGNKPYECEVCFKRFTTKYFHKKHQRLHTGERPYQCATCSKSFAFQQSFHKHLLYHTTAKPHACAECGQAFKELSTLHNHQRIHTGERPFVCETCGKAFRQRVSYLVHRRIHTGVLPYKCSACSKSFRYKVSQRTHKCPAQPPGSVVRQSELVQRLILRGAGTIPAPPPPVAAASEAPHTISAPQLPPLLTINEESLHHLLSIFPN